MTSIQLNICSIAFRNRALTDLIPPLAKIGYDGIEVFGRQVETATDTELTALRTLARENAVALPVVSPYFVLTRGAEEYATTMETARRFVHVARQLGAVKVRTFTDVADGVGSDVAQERHWQQAVDGLRAICDMAPELQFVVETHEKTLADTVESILQLLERVGRKNLKVNFQPNESFLAYGLTKAFDALRPHITHMHLGQVTAGHGDGWVEAKGAVDFAAFIAHIRRAGYADSMSVEYCWQGVPWERAVSACGFMRGLLGK